MSTIFYGVPKWLAPKVNEVQSIFLTKFALKGTVFFFLSEKYWFKGVDTPKISGVANAPPLHKIVIYLKLVCGENAHQPIYCMMTLHS
jgi:hypothetical protein